MRNILDDEKYSYEFLADTHSGLTFYDMDSSFETWCNKHNLYYEGWCKNTKYWNPNDKTERIGFFFFDKENDKDIWIHGFGKEAIDILESIYGKEQLNKRLQDKIRDKEYIKIPKGIDEKKFIQRCYNSYIENIFK